MCNLNNNSTLRYNVALHKATSHKVCSCMHVFVHLFVHIDTSFSDCKCMCVYECVYVCEYVCVCLCVCMCACVCVCGMCVYVHTYALQMAFIHKEILLLYVYNYLC